MLNTTPANRAHLLVANTKHAQGCTGAPVLVVIALIAVEYSSRPRFNDTVVFAHTGYADMQMAGILHGIPQIAARRQQGVVGVQRKKERT